MERIFFTMFGKRFWKNEKYFKKILMINSFWATGFFLYPLKTSENFWFSDVFFLGGEGGGGGIERDQWHEMGESFHLKLKI